MSELNDNFNGKSMADLLGETPDLENAISRAVKHDDVRVAVNNDVLKVQWQRGGAIFSDGVNANRTYDDTQIYKSKVEIKLTEQGHLTTEAQNFIVNSGKLHEPPTHERLLPADVSLSNNEFLESVVGIVKTDADAREGNGKKSMGGTILHWQPGQS